LQNNSAYIHSEDRENKDPFNFEPKSRAESIDFENEIFAEESASQVGNPGYLKLAKERNLNKQEKDKALGKHSQLTISEPTKLIPFEKI